MRGAFPLLILALSLTGCGWFDLFNTVKVDNPVMGPPPPRTKMANRATREKKYADAGGFLQSVPSDQQDSDVVVAGAIDDESGGTGDSFEKNRVVAVVNGEPIFEAEVLAPYAMGIRKAKHTATPAQLRDLQREVDDLIQRDLDGHIENRLVISALRSSLKKEQIEMFEEHLNDQFNNVRIPEMLKKLGLTSSHELDALMQAKSGRSLASQRTEHINRMMAGQYLHEKSTSQKSEIERRDLLDYYERHIDDFTLLAEVNWQQIVINHAAHGGKDPAFEVLEEVIKKLRTSNGESFTAVARENSNGPKAKNGGRWGWTQKGSLADADMETMLFKLPVGRISQVIERKSAYHLLMVIERKPARTRRFAEVQNEIRETLEEEQKRSAAEKVLDELYESAVIKTIYDDQADEDSKDDNIVLPFR